ncbi:MAG: hypothetical protein CK424_02205 [Legionella sp.]|nr:MAG: hypothetical protein CK424_02205 [Legionella sp.]
MSDSNHFKPIDPLTFETATANRSRLITLLDSVQSDAIYCDLRGVQSCDSAGLAFLIDAQRLCRQRSKRWVMEYLTEDIRALAKLYGVEQILMTGETQ